MSVESENWRAIPGYVGVYEVSDLGRVRSLSRTDSRGRSRHGKIVSPRKARSGHLSVALYVNGARRDVLIHHLVLEAFLEPRPAGMEGCHWDDDPANNRLDNLRWDTRAANILDSVRNGGHAMANRITCPKGHAYSPDNTYMRPGGSRVCRECNRVYREVNREERRAKGREYMRRRRAMEIMTGKAS